MTTENSEKKDLKKLLGNPKITFVLGKLLTILYSLITFLCI